MTKPTTITVTVSNICCNPIRAQWRVNRRIEQAAAAGGGAHFGSEIEIPRYKAAWTKIMGAHRLSTFGVQSEVPVSLNEALWKVEPGVHVHRIHGGLAHVSPSRWVTEVKATRHTGEKVAFLACHPVSQGYEADRKKSGTTYPWRHDHLVQYDEWLTKKTATLVAEGYSVVIGGDMNDPHPPPFHAGQVELLHSGLDHVFVVPAAGLKIAPVPHDNPHIPPSRFLGMDHPILTASFHLIPA